jgi:hypothetical protein
LSEYPEEAQRRNVIDVVLIQKESGGIDTAQHNTQHLQKSEAKL